MKTYIVLLRGINVDGKNILPMTELVSLLEVNDLHQVKTYIQSGNIILQSRNEPTSKIAQLIASNFGFKPAVLVLNKSEFASAVDNNPFEVADGKTVHFYFCNETPQLNSAQLATLEAESEQYQ